MNPLLLIPVDQLGGACPAVDANDFALGRPSLADGDVDQSRSESVSGMPPGGQQQLDVELGAINRWRVFRSIAHDQEAHRLLTILSDEQAPTGSKIARSSASVSAPGERLAAPLLGLTARNQPRDCIIEEIDQQTGVLRPTLPNSYLVQHTARLTREDTPRLPAARAKWNFSATRRRGLPTRLLHTNAGHLLETTDVIAPRAKQSCRPFGRAGC